MVRLAALVLSFCLLAAGGAPRAEVTFAVLGDMPYDSDTQTNSLRYIGDKLRKAEVDLVIHYGDIKGGGEPCDPDLMQARREIVLGLVPGRVVYTPGDNDWTDCDRDEAGRFDEMDQLKKLRRLFFSGPPPSGDGWRVGRQSKDYPENALWRLGKLQFVTLHVVGTGNGRNEILPSKKATEGKSAEEVKGLTRQLEEQAREAAGHRDEANLEWLAKAFTAADGAEGLVVVMHADPTDLKAWEKTGEVCDDKVLVNCDPYARLMNSLSAQAIDFENPVLLVHGSTGSYCLYRDFGGPATPNLWRLNGPGDFVVIDASIVTFKAGADPPFEVHGLLTGDPVALCDAPRQEP